MDSNRIKAVMDLHDYLDTIGEDRPRIAEFLKGLSIDPRVMSDAVVQVSTAVQVAKPEYGVDIVNYLFKLGITIGYKFAIRKEMERTFGDLNPNSNEKDGSS